MKQFCKEQGLMEYSFYALRKRLQEPSASAQRIEETDQGFG